MRCGRQPGGCYLAGTQDEFVRSTACRRPAVGNLPLASKTLTLPVPLYRSRRYCPPGEKMLEFIRCLDSLQPLHLRKS